MFRDETCLDRFAAMLVGASIAGAATVGVAVAPGLFETLGAGAGLVARLSGQRRIDAERVLGAVQRDLKADWRAWGAHSSHADAGLRESVVLSFEQVIPHCAPIPAEVVGQRLDPDGIARAVLAKAVAALPAVYGDPDPRNADAHLARSFLVNVTSRAYARLLAEPGYIDTLAPQLWRELLEAVARIDATTQRTEAKVDALPDAIVAKLMAALGRSGEAETARAAGITDARVLGLARRIAADVEDIDRAFAELERAVEVAIEVQARGQAGSNTGDFVDAVLARMAELSAAGRDDEAAAEADRAFAEWEERRKLEEQNGIALLEAGLRADILRRDAASAAKRIARRIEIEAADPAAHFDALRHEQDVWYERGRDKGLNFDLEIAIELARVAWSNGRNSDQRGAALDDLGIALARLGRGESGKELLEDAVGAFRAALAERTRDRVPLDWAKTQSNLASTLSELGQRESGTTRLEQAVEAYRSSLEVQTRDREPLEWASNQGNLGIALRTLGERESGTALLQEAVAAFRAALEVQTRERAPIDWARNQMNLGNALSTQGERESGTARLEEAVTAFHAALEERTRERVPLDWAMTQTSLGIALLILGERDSCTAQIEAAVEAYRAAMLEWTRERVPLYWAMTQMNLGNALTVLGEREGGTARLEEAVEAYRAALEEETRDRMPLYWAGTTGNQGLALLLLADRTTDLAMARRAVEQITTAEAVLRDGGHAYDADELAGKRPAAEALVARLMEG